MFMLTGLKVSPLACKCVFYRSELWKSSNADVKYTSGYSSKNREKNGVICLAIMFIPGVMVIKMLKMAHFFAFSDNCSKQVVTAFGFISTCAWKILLSFFSN